MIRLKPILEEQLAHYPKLFRVFKEIEIPLIPVLMDMEMAGIALDRDFMASFSIQLDERMQSIEQEIYTSVGQTFIINSTQQLSDILISSWALRVTEIRST